MIQNLKFYVIQFMDNSRGINFGCLKADYVVQSYVSVQMAPSVSGELITNIE